jgi:hypothetical protein
MVYALTHGLSSILPGVYTHFLIQIKFDKLGVLGIFTKSFYINITKTWGTIDKPMVSGNVPRPSLNVPGPSLNGLNLREKPSLYRFSFEKISIPIEST